MKDYLPSISIFMLALLLLFKVTTKQVRSVNQLRTERNNATLSLESQSQALDIKRFQLTNQIGGNDAIQFSKLYGKVLREGCDISNIAQAINREAEEFLIPIQEQKTAVQSISGGKQAHQYEVAILGQFHDVLNWLGNIESHFTFGRITEIEFSPSADLVNLRTKILVPQVKFDVSE